MNLRDFYRAQHRPRLKASTAVDYDMQLSFFERYLSSLSPCVSPDLSALTHEHVLGATNWQLARGRTNSTANKLRRVLLAIWKTAYDCAKAAPPPRIKKLSARKHEPTAWTMAEFERLLYAAGQLDGKVGPFETRVWFPVLLRVAFNSGLRLSALMSIRWSWINSETGVIVIPPETQKDSEGQKIKLLPGTVAALEKLRSNGHPGVFDDWPFDRKVIQWPAITRLLRKAIVASGLRTSLATVTKRDLWHKLRRTFATHVYKQSKDVEMVRDMLGHSDIDVTYSYIDMSIVGERSQADYLSDPQPRSLRIVG